MNRRLSLSILATTVILVAGCGAKTDVSGRHVYDGPRQPPPDRIIVHDIASTTADVAPWSQAGAAAAEAATEADAETVAAGRKLGALIARELVSSINEMGLTAVRSEGQRDPDVGDIVLSGHFESIDEGSRAKRMGLGFGSGNAEVSVRVEGYLMKADGLELVGARKVASGGGKSPGVALPLAVTLATANPIGIIVGGAVKASGEISGKSTTEGSAKRIAEQLAEELRVGFRRQGWI